MYFKFDSSHLFLFAFCIYLNCVFTLDPSDHAAGKVLIKEENKTSSKHLGVDPVDSFRVNKKSGEVLKIPFNKPTNERPMVQSENQGISVNKGNSRLVLEGGGIVDLTSTAQPISSLLNTDTIEDGTSHSKGSKPRKGVQHPGSSVVPRKGVDPLGAFSLNQSSARVTIEPSKELPSVVTDKQTPSKNKTESLINQPDHQQINEQSPEKVPHHKKPVVVTDIEDVDDFEKYPIIQTSTTGEDYIIIGIVIVLGIWCSIFGALIFYRRAGEYWDRRHYRRMDFLVEGMYND